MLPIVAVQLVVISMLLPEQAIVRPVSCVLQQGRKLREIELKSLSYKKHVESLIIFFLQKYVIFYTII